MALIDDGYLAPRYGPGQLERIVNVFAGMQQGTEQSMSCLTRHHDKRPQYDAGVI
jgi:hypothetical protein